MSEPLFVGFDTSNYTTSAAVCDADGEVLLNARTLLPVREGERGLRQSDAVFFHVRNLPDLLGQVRETVARCAGGWLFGQSPPRRRFLYAVLSLGHHGGGSVRGGD